MVRTLKAMKMFDREILWRNTNSVKSLKAWGIVPVLIQSVAWLYSANSERIDSAIGNWLTGRYL